MGTNPVSRRNKYQTQFQPLMNECRDMVVVYTNALLAELFSSSDTALMGFAQKAESNEMQNRFFEAMNEVQNQQSAIEQRFRANIRKNFNEFWSLSPDSDSDSADDLGIDALELVEEVAMDESIATENMISRTENNNMTQLYALGQRLAVVNGGDMLEQHELPAGPSHLVNSFQDALSLLNVSSKIRLIILALFNRCVLKQVDSLYEDINNTLKDAGVLPHLKPTIAKPRGSETDNHSQTAEEQEQEQEQEQGQGQGQTASPEELGEALFTSILDLLGAKRRGQGTAKQQAAGAANRTADGAPIQPVQKKELVTAINELQPASRASYMPDATEDLQFIPNIEIDDRFLQRIKSTLVEERTTLYNKISQERLDTIDEDTIDLVGMLFEYMLNDPVLPNVAKALISHLHTPYLKVTITDRSMLTNTQHTSRRLLDSLVEAGSHWLDESNLKRGIYPEMQIVVDRILKEFTDDLTLFDELFNNFREKMWYFKQKTQILEKRAQEAAMGREKLNIAKQRAKQEIKARLHGATLPRLIKEFLLQSWTDKLIFTLLRHPEGELSSDWKDALRLADDLVWVFESKTTSSASEKMELAKLLPTIRQQIKEGLASLGGYNLDQGSAIFGLLENPESVLSATTTVFDKEVDKKRAPAIQQVGGKAPAKTETDSEEIPEEELAMMDKIRKIEFGTWFEISDGTPEATKRARLSWLSPLTSTCMFVDRAGIQTAIKPLRELSQELIDGRSKLLEESSDPFVERTLHAIKRMLKRSLATADQAVSEIDPSENGKK